MSLVLAIVDAWRPLLSRLQEVADFGTNPGALRMLTYAPDHLPSRPALVVALHGSTQTAATYDLGAGWSTLADQYGFVLLMPEQSRHNNANCSFNWFLPGDIRRDEGEACSIAQMIERAALDFNVDRNRIFVAGLSAGGAMTLVMLATYPDIFAAGAVVAGLPYGGATNVQEALRGMFQESNRSPRELGDLVREAAPATTRWPKLSVWHGSADRTVRPSNAGEIVKQWLDLHGLPAAPMSEQMIDGHSRQLWWDADGGTVIESYTIADMAHGAPLSRTEAGVAGPFMIETGISSSDHIVRFFGLTDAPSEIPAIRRSMPLFGVLKKATRPRRIRAVRAWRTARTRLARMLGAAGREKAPTVLRR